MAAAEESPIFSAGTMVAVLTTRPLKGALDYRVADEMTLRRGDIVSVPLGRMGETLGVVVGPGMGSFEVERLKHVAHLYEGWRLSEDILIFVQRVAHYVLASPGQILDLVLRVPDALVPETGRVAYRVAPWGKGTGLGAKMTPARKRALETGRDGLARSLSQWAEEAGVSTGVLRGLADAGLIETVTLPPPIPPARPDPNLPSAVLSPVQEAAAKHLRDAVNDGRFSAHLLDGVTGSGKTEVYFEAIAAALHGGGQAMILMPEIALTVQFLERFEQRFGVKPTEWHSDLTGLQRRRNWALIARGEAQVVVGARSALFLPFPALKLIVVDEEHDSAFKQVEGLHYHARDMAVLRAQGRPCPIVLASATPSLETYVNAVKGRYAHLRLANRHRDRPMPTTQLIDLRRHAPEPQHWLSPPLVEAVSKTLEAQEQVLLFLNRRGYSPLTLCCACGKKMGCPRCASMLVEHRYLRRLKCHHCDFEMKTPETCPHCQARGSLAACGPGVERVQEEVMRRWPAVRLQVASSDLLHGPRALQDAINKVAAHEIDILIGTQMVAKGHNFPMLTLIGVVDGDMGLEGADPRARERTFQLLHQVAGRAGRGDRPGHVLIQTHAPETPVMQALASGDRDAFYAAEMKIREENDLPPYVRLTALILQGRNEEAVKEQALWLRRTAPEAQGVLVWGPSPAPIAMIRGEARYRLALHAARGVNMQAYLLDWLKDFKAHKGVRLSVDVDAQSFL